MPTHHYCFQAGILGINRQINSEAADVFYRKNLFVSLTCTHPEFDKKVAGVVVVATGHHASNFKHQAMEVHLSHSWDRDEGAHHPYEQFIIAGDDVPQLCNILPGIYLERVRLWVDGWVDGLWVATNVCVQISIKRIADTENENTPPNNESSTVKRLLEPFRRLYGMRLRVGGHVTPSYKEEIEQCAARHPPTAADLVTMVIKDRDKGNEAKQRGNLAAALRRYESAMDLFKAGCMRLTIHPVTVETPELLEPKTLAEMNLLEINLMFLLASTYLELGRPAESYRCVQELGLTRSNFGLYRDLFRPVWQDCAHIMFCKALAGKTLGQPVQALLSLDIALKFSFADEEMENERKVLCGLVRKQMDRDLHVTRVRNLDIRRTELENRQQSATAQSVNGWKDLEALINNEFFD